MQGILINFLAATHCSSYHYCTISFNKTQNYIIRRFKSCLRCVEVVKVENYRQLSQLKIRLKAANIYLFKVNNRSTRKRFEIYLKLTIKTPERRHDVVPVFLSLTLNIFHTSFYCFYHWLWTSKCLLGKYFHNGKQFHKVNSSSLTSQLCQIKLSLSE